MRYIISIFSVCGLAITVAACVGPDYKRPDVTTPKAFKESVDWQYAKPQEDAPHGAWWEAFSDPTLNTLETQVAISNQTVKSYEAAYRQAQALVTQARASYFPVVSANASGGRTQSQGLAGPTINNSYSASLGASWQPDIWGKIARTVESSSASAQASEGDLHAAVLSAQATLAIDYVSLRADDEQKRLLEDTVKAYQRTLEITQFQYKSGVAARSDVLQAQVQLEQTQAQLIDIGVQRAQFEHAIALLIGKAPADFTLAEEKTLPTLPDVPPMLPSTLLERRPDIAAAERRMAAANAQIGVAEAAFFPAFSFDATGGYQSNNISQWFTLPQRIWSLGPSAALTLFDAGARQAQVEAASASYDQAVANYRGVVLAAFGEVEDNIAALQILAREAALREKTVADAKAATAIVLNQYKAGTVSYLNVSTAQTTELSNAISALTVTKTQWVAAVNLITALGGNWQPAALGELDTDMLCDGGCDSNEEALDALEEDEAL